MTQPRKQPRSQAYDTSLKDLIHQQIRDILSELLPGATYEDTLNVEIIRPTMRADKVYKVKYRGQDHILHLEFESGSDNNMPARLLAYNAVLYLEYRLPVISIIIYPFRTKMAEPPLRVKSGEDVLIAFQFQTLPLFMLDAERYVREHIVCMYPLLPTMRHVNHVLIKQAMSELAALYRDDEVTLAQQFVWMELLLERTDTIDPQEKVMIQEALNMFEQLWDESPKVQRIRAESEARGEAKGILLGEMQAARRMLVSIVRARFPALVQLVQQQASQMDDLNKLDLLVQQVATAPDEDAVRRLFNPSVA